jgi:hypothetical protein
VGSQVEVTFEADIKDTVPQTGKDKN